MPLVDKKDVFGANRGPRPSADGLVSVDGLAAIHSKGHILGLIKFYPHFSLQLSN